VNFFRNGKHFYNRWCHQQIYLEACSRAILKSPMLKLVLSVWLWHNPKFKIYIYFSSIVAQKNKINLAFFNFN
jgi:hypothetical protein